MKDIRKKAKELMKGSCRVCAICDGRACAGEVPGMGGLDNGTSFKNNVSSLAKLTLNMRVIHDVVEPITAVSWMGLSLSMPVVAAPIGGMFNFNNAVEDDDYVDAILQGSHKAGVIGCVGDGVPPVVIDSASRAICKVKGYGIPFIKPWEGAELDEKLEKMLSTNCSIMGMDIDAAGLVTLRKMGRPVGPKTVKELGKIIEKAHEANVKFILKGIMTIADAKAAKEAGADGIVVSNHGGRVLSSTPGTADVLPAIADAVKGKISIMVDGGVRNGQDVFKMLALGADIVGIGRPLTIAAIGGGVDGVAKYMDSIRAELSQAMILTGCKDIESIGKESLFRA